MIASCRSRVDFRRLTQQGKRRSGRHVWVKAVEDEQIAPPRVAFAIGRRNGNAVTRNRIKRRLRAAIHVHRDQIPGGIYMVGWKASDASSRPEPTFDELSKDIERCLVGG